MLKIGDIVKYNGTSWGVLREDEIGEVIKILTELELHDTKFEGNLADCDEPVYAVEFPNGIAYGTEDYFDLVKHKREDDKEGQDNVDLWDKASGE
jgi:hypothetical protein